MRLRKYFFVLLLMSVSLAASAQYTKEFKRVFLEAEYLYETGFYKEAFNRYKNLLTLDPGNNNILFHCGACCLRIPGREQEAITYLQEASVGVNLSYKTSHKEPGAPVMTYFMLGRAYHLHNHFSEAVENYELYLEMGTDEDPVQKDYARLQIEACERAKEAADASPTYEFQSVLDQFDDDLPSCSNPVISGDGNILIFLVDYPSDKKIMMTTRTGRLWSRPRVINSEIGMVGETSPACLSFEGTELYLVHHYYSHSDIYLSRFEGGRWTRAEALNHNINGRTSEIHASISGNGDALYFVSDRRGGHGSFDIYLSRKDNSGEWGPPRNLGPVINTPYEEHTPFISKNDSILFFSSQGHSSIGGIDVFYSVLRPDGTWEEPLNIGYPVNTSGEDLFFNPGWGELDGLYAVRRESDPTTNTINMAIELEPPETAAMAGSRDEPLTEPIDPLTQPAPLDTAQPIDPLTQAIEPAETEEIHEVLNRGAVSPDKSGSAAEAGRNISAGIPAPAISGSAEISDSKVTGPMAVSRELLTAVPFPHDSYDLNLAARLEAGKIFDLLQEYQSARAEITGHADPTGSPEYNVLISLRRAESVARYLENKGISPERMSVRGLGEAAPRARNRYPDGTIAHIGRYVNRQVVVRITTPDPIVANLAGICVPRVIEPDPWEKDHARNVPIQLTIQIRALYRPVDLSRYGNLEELKEYPCKDGYYRYTTGTFNTLEEASRKLGAVRRLGYGDAFIRSVDWYNRMMGP